MVTIENAETEAKGGVVVGSRVKELVKSQELNMAGDFVAAADVAMQQLIIKAAARCKANGRKTIRPEDL